MISFIIGSGGDCLDFLREKHGRERDPGPPEMHLVCGWKILLLAYPKSRSINHPFSLTSRTREILMDSALRLVQTNFALG